MAISFGEKVKTLFKLIGEPAVLSALLSQRYEGYLIDTGWFESYRKKTPFDIKGNPVPWFTYSCNDFLDERLKKEMTVFEFGSGNSTLYFASKAARVVSLEHNRKWYDLQKDRIPDNVKLIYSDQDKVSEYSRGIEQLNEKFDIIIIDAVDRMSCLYNSTAFLKEGGVIILDDSERPEYMEGKEFMKEKDFKKLDFWGIAPGLLYKKCTTIFYKDNNCLDI